MTISKKAKGLVAIVAGLLIAASASMRLDDNFETRAMTYLEPQVITMKSRQMSYQPMLIAPYKTMDIYLSDEKSSDFEFTSVGMSWEEIIPGETEIKLQIQVKEDSGWTEWTEAEIEGDPFAEVADNVSKKYALVSTNPATKMRYRFLLYGDGKSSPIAKNVDYTFVRAGNRVSTDIGGAPPVPKPQYAASSTSDPVAGPSGIISRKEWGANESYRYLQNNNTEAELIELDDSFYEKYSDELGYSRVVETDEDGDKYKWPLQYPEKGVKKIIIHHSATTGNLDNPIQAIRDIYYYHSVTRGWGDIGYNYIFDLDGNVYEGRYGGEGVIGAHSGPGNHGSIGVMLLGNYQDTPAPEEAVVKISQFIYKKAKIHGIVSDGSSMFRGKVMPNIFGHKDIMSTACPGEYLYEKLPVIRILAKKNFELKEKFIKDYDYQNVSDLYYLELKPDETIDVTVKLENIGKVDWNNSTSIVMEENPELNGVLTFSNPNSLILAKMKENLVEPGQMATFNFSMKAGLIGKTVYLNIIPNINGNTTVPDPMVLPITVQPPIYKYEYIDAVFPPEFLETDKDFNLRIRVRNAGNVNWTNIGDQAITFNSDQGGLKATLNENFVAPGDVGTFTLNFKSPRKGGYYRYNFTPLINGIKFSSGENVGFETLFYAREYDANVMSKTIVNNWQQGSVNPISMQLRNIGIHDWSKKDLQLFVLRENGISVSDLDMSPTTIKPGETATVSFNVTVAEDAELLSKIFTVRAKNKGNALNFVPAIFKYTVIEKRTDVGEPTGENTEPTIRVKLSFEGNPEITANDDFDLYSGNTFVGTLNDGEIAVVTKEGSKYSIAAPSGNFVKNGPIRFVPKSTSILEIGNFEHRPGWNDTLNDNEYRGILEVVEDDNGLIVINELPLESYLKGLGEVSNSEEVEKIKAIMIAARSYAKYYMDIDQKFPGKPYHLDDNPEVSQKYLGYGLEKRSPNVAAAVDATHGMAVTYNDVVVKTPYFNQSDGTQTKSAKEVWGWTNTPYLVSVSDSFCDGDKFLGHGVGLSGCGAKGMALKGYTYDEILEHYYTNIQLNTLY